MMYVNESIYVCYLVIIILKVINLLESYRNFILYLEKKLHLFFIYLLLNNKKIIEINLKHLINI